MNEDIKERAFNKIMSTYLMVKREDTSRYFSCGVSVEIATQMVKSHELEVEVYNYILGLIEKDNKL